MATRKTPSTTPRPSPFGAPRSGGTGTWPDDKTFLGDSSDPTSGITYIGAREYDPNSGRFISVDPVLDTSDPQSLNGYTYADNNPVTDSDPTGLWLDDGSGHNEPRSEGPSGPSSPALAYLREKKRAPAAATTPAAQAERRAPTVTARPPGPTSRTHSRAPRTAGTAPGCTRYGCSTDATPMAEAIGTHQWGTATARPWRATDAPPAKRRPRCGRTPTTWRQPSR
ncbi:RHS repeat-associated core domain-containing protein [Streptomyces mirabilis]|uniref:RHS repeat-associated core domain-containing protein n=1 Tax=Streptomyces mirabilis TaxID=68239 RepID=UPI003625637E